MDTTQTGEATTRQRYDSLSGPPGSAKLADRLAAVLTREMGVPVRRPAAIEIALREAIAARKAAKP